ncbi:hypothetical protein OSTOST_22000, partial [Ostertagia ostertagi]
MSPPPHHHQQQIPQQQIPPQHIQQQQMSMHQQPIAAPPQQQIQPQVPPQPLHQMPQVSVNGVDNVYQNNGVQHGHNTMETASPMQLPPSQPPVTVELKPTVFNPYAEPMPEPETRKSVEEQEKPEIKAEAPPQEEVDVKPDPVIPEPLIQPSANLFDDRDDATPPMRTDVVEEEGEVLEQQATEIEPETEAAPEPEPEPDEQKEMSPEPPVTCSSTIAPADYSTLSDETQPAIAETDEKSVDTTSLAIAEDEEAKADVEPEEDVSDEPTPGPSSSRDPSPEESEVTAEEPETEPPSVKPSKRSRNKDRVATLSKEEVYDDRDATPSEVAESTDGVFTEPSTPAPESRKPKRLPIVRKRSTSKWADAIDGVDDDAEDSILTTDSQETQSSDQQIVEKELEEVDKRAVAKVKRFRQKKSHSNNDNEEEDFNSDYTIVDRVVDVGTGDDGLEYALVKWKSLAYDEVTWEPVESIPEEK